MSQVAHLWAELILVCNIIFIHVHPNKMDYATINLPKCQSIAAKHD